MSLNVTGPIKVFQIEDGSKSSKAKGVWGTPPRRDGDEWENDFINILFVGKSVDKLTQVQEKDVIFLDGCILRNRTYTTRDNQQRTWTELKVFSFLTKEEAEDKGLMGNKHEQNNSNGNTGSDANNGSGGRAARGSRNTRSNNNSGSGSSAARGNGRSRRGSPQR
jgi:single-stranded DNA-binding protein